MTDTARVAHLVELAVEFALQHLKPEGALVTKVFHGSGYSELVELFRANFRVVKAVKPKASRDKSSETFIVGFGLKNPRRALKQRCRPWPDAAQIVHSTPESVRLAPFSTPAIGFPGY